MTLEESILNEVKEQKALAIIFNDAITSFCQDFPDFGAYIESNSILDNIEFTGYYTAEIKFTEDYTPLDLESLGIIIEDPDRDLTNFHLILYALIPYFEDFGVSLYGFSGYGTSIEIECSLTDESDD